jgi:nitrite reductase/ring-hydroxylating ferredoxin subunit
MCVFGRHAGHAGPPGHATQQAERLEDYFFDKASFGFAFSKDHANVVCPWHGYEFDVATGRHQGYPRACACGR